MATDLPPVGVPANPGTAFCEQAPLPMAMLEGKLHMVCYVNAAFCRLMDRSAADLVGKPLQELLPLKDECLTLVDRVFRTGRPECHTEEEHPLVHPVFWSYTMWPVIAADSRVRVMLLVTETAQAHHTTVAINEALVLGSVRQHKLTEVAEGLNVQLWAEISQRQQAEAALRESDERFRGLFASAPMAVFACDRHAVLRHYNSRAVELWGRQPVCGVDQHCGSLRLWRPDGTPLPHEKSPIVEVLRTGVPEPDLELIIERPDGSRLPVLFSFAALTSSEGEITGAITSFMDLTQRKKFEQRSLRAQRMESIGTLAGGIAHNLNNTLGPIIMSIDLLKMRFSDPASVELLAVIDSCAHRGADMVRQVLAFARGVEGRRVEVQIGPLLRDIEKIVNDTFPRHVRIQTCFPTELWSVLGDSTQLHQVLLNLCLNARDAMPDGGGLTISAENRQIDATDEDLAQNLAATPGPYVLLEVTDTGVGIPEEIVDHIFDPFFTTKDVGKGSGLGLSTSLAVVKSHGGFLYVASKPGMGTTFQVLIPAQPEKSSMAPTTTVCERRHGGGSLILVVDDEEPMRRMTKQILETYGYRVVLAGDGKEAAAIYAERGAEIAAMITDMSMPVMEGPELIHILRSMNPELPIIGVSGLAATTHGAKLASLGVQHFLTKPYTTAELLTIVTDALEGVGLTGDLAPNAPS